jgi:hypothetical protein
VASRPAGIFRNPLPHSCRGAIETSLAERFQEIIKGIGVKCAQRILIVGRHKDRGRHVFFTNPVDHIETIHLRHLNVKKHKVRPLFEDGLDRGLAVTVLTNHRNFEPDTVWNTYAGNFPLWRPDPSNQGLYRVSSKEAFQSGWRTRAFEETALDCLNDFYSLRFCPSQMFCHRQKREKCWTRGNGVGRDL